MANFMKHYTDGGQITTKKKKPTAPKIEAPIITQPTAPIAQTTPAIQTTTPATPTYTGNFFINDGTQYQEVSGDKAKWQNTAKERGWQFFDTLPEGTQYYGLDGNMHGGTPTVTPTVPTPTVPETLPEVPTVTPAIPGTPTGTPTPVYNVPDNIVWEAPPPPPEYVDPYADKINQYLDRILTPPQFNYDYQTDPKYQVYKDEYTGLGNIAFENTVGRASALTGGRPSSWAISAASQARNSYMQDLANIIPTLEQQAYSRHRDSIGDIYNQLNELQGMSKDSYGRYRDTVGDYQTDRNFNRGIYESDRGYSRNVYEDERDYRDTQTEQAKNEWISTIGQFSNDFQKEINRINANVANGDTSEEWKIPYLTVARQEKIKQMEADKAAQNQAALANKAAQAEAQGKAAKDEYDRVMDLWKSYGVANDYIASVLGVPVGAKTADYDLKSAKAETESSLTFNNVKSYIDQTFMVDEYKTAYDEYGNPTRAKTGAKTIADKTRLIEYLKTLPSAGVSEEVFNSILALYGLTERDFQNADEAKLKNSFSGFGEFRKIENQ